MQADVKRPVFDWDESYEAAARTVRWVCLGLVLISFPFTTPNGVVVLTLTMLTGAYNTVRYIPFVNRRPFFRSRLNSLAVDHVFVLSLVFMTGGLASPYYPFFFLLIIAVIASFGIAGFAFSLSAQVAITLILLHTGGTAMPSDPNFQFIIKIVFLIVFSLVAEQSVRSRDEEHLLESRFTRRIENERQRLLSLINSLSSAVVAVDDHGKVYLYNGAALELLNTNRDITGESINQLMPLYDEQDNRANLMHIIEHQERAISRQDLVLKANDGSKMILDLTVSPVHILGYGRDTWGGYMAVFHDITKQKSLDEQRDEFISVTSHELRTPLAIAEANLSTALLPGFASMDPKAKGLVMQAHENIVFLAELIQDLTTLSRAERGDLPLKAELIDVGQLIKQLARDYSFQAKAKKLTLNCELGSDLGSVYTGESELREVLQNFLTNAIKYTPKGTVTIRAKRAAGGTEIAVVDEGIGISAGDKAKIFAKFYRSEDYRTRQTGGTGLGLYITHKLAEKLGATITFTSKLNHGSTFRVLIPNTDSPAATDRKVATAVAGGH
jgi:PAS domain S-box-containing protein